MLMYYSDIPPCLNPSCPNEMRFMDYDHHNTSYISLPSSSNLNYNQTSAYDVDMKMCDNQQESFTLTDHSDVHMNDVSSVNDVNMPIVSKESTPDQIAHFLVQLTLK